MSALLRRAGQLLAAALLSLPTVAAAADPAADSFTVSETGVEAFSLPAPALTPDILTSFRDGRILFRQAWMMAPARDDADFIGLGPVYNDISCLGCHVKNGRGTVPAGPEEPLHGLLIRLSLPGPGPHGGPRPHPAYGDQLNDHAIPAVPAEGQARLSYREQPVTLAGGEIVRLRGPHLVFSDLAFGPLGRKILTSPRLAQPVFGGGLLEAIPEAAILQQAANQKALGLRGHVNRVWNIAENRTTLGRFGWKANQPSLAQQAAGAANGDMGLTSPLFPAKNCTPAQAACAAAARGPQPELNASRLDALAAYLRGLAVPARRDPAAPEIAQGETLFAQAGCGGCHVSGWITGPLPGLPAAAGQTIHPYTDLLLHDMGDGLADGRPDFLASGREWRTPPLWGLGLTLRINPAAGFLHDGRARTVSEAVLWHGGEAETARQTFIQMPAQDRKALLAFLNDL